MKIRTAKIRLLLGLLYLECTVVCNTDMEPITLINTHDAALCPKRDCTPCNGKQDAANSNSNLTFAAPEPVSELNTTADEDDPSLTADQLEIFFERSADIFSARRKAATAPWDPPAVVTELSSQENDSCPSISSDGLTIYFSSSRGGSETKGKLDIWFAKRPTRLDPWGIPQPATQLNSSEDDKGPTMTLDEQVIVLSSTRSGGSGALDVFIAQQPASLPGWPTPTPLGINTAANDEAPWIDDGATLLVFASNRNGGKGCSDLWFSRRKSKNDSFATPSLIGVVNTSANETDPWLSSDLRTLYFSNGDDIYVARQK